ncbi:Uma2 family endonuclease [Thalassiella azotivora]
MSVTVPLASGTPLTWEMYEQLPEDLRAEYVDGRLQMTPSPTRQHQAACLRLATALQAVVRDDTRVALAWAWKPDVDEFIPDVMVHPVTTEQVRFTGTPLLVVEVLSTNRSTDLVLKTNRYARAGLAHYWVLDPTTGTLDAFDLTEDGLYARVAQVTAGQPQEVVFGPSTLQVDVAALLAD